VGQDVTSFCYHAGVDDLLSPALRTALQRAARATPGLDVLLVFGSRARGDEWERSDWDFGYLAGPRMDAAGLLATLIDITGSDRIDLVDLSRASGLLRYRAAREGVAIYEGRPGLADAFRFEAARFWCDVSPLLARGHDEVLADLER
jgi:predicted nucleotidyltransferase